MRVAALLFGAEDAGSFVQAGMRGLQRAAGDFGCRLEPHFCVDTEVTLRTAQLRRIAGTRPDLIVVHGGQGVEPLATVAAEVPAQAFALAQGTLRAANVACYEVLLEQPAYLAGALAALCTRSGVVAHLSGEAVGPGIKGQAAFRAGALHMAPGMTVLSRFCGHQHDPDLAYAAVLDHARNGADIVFTMLGLGRAGAIAACRATGVRQIGDGIDWCAAEPDVFIASAVADVAWCGYRAVEDVVRGGFRGMRASRVGLERADVCRLVVQAGVPRVISERLAGVRVPGGGD